MYVCLYTYPMTIEHIVIFDFFSKNTIRIANSLDPDETATFCGVSSGSKLFAKAFMPNPPSSAQSGVICQIFCIFFTTLA